MKNRLFVYYLLCLLISACSHQKEKQAQTLDDGNSEQIEEHKELPPLDDGEVFYRNKEPFGETVNLTGTHLDNDTVIFRVRESEMLVKDNQIVLKNGIFMRFTLPDMRFLGYSGSLGQGPHEFNSPHITPTSDTTLLCYVFESSNQKLYRLEKSGKLVYCPFTFSKAKQPSGHSDKALVNIAPDDFIYAETSATGKSIFRTAKIGDSIQTREIFNLGLNPKRKSWASYIGDFVVNPKLNRMAYAYKYFKIIKFMDMEAQTVKTVNFEREKFDESTLYKVNGLDQNVTHYWGACAGDDYVYFLYSGRTPVDVMRENNRGQYYIFVEQYDWNGNPVHKYKLDHWGYFTVDEKNKLIYLLSTNDDDPFFVFSINLDDK
ncbi:MAG: TolB-like 6-bladed beta-propeller domain-containing protein [Tannerella sp.]|nr:TolB-like 6-bladed beta-propeller domain-containing protein [Tannerella sp.]